MVKRRAFIKELKNFAKETGQHFAEEEGAKHTKVYIGDKQTTVPRHSEINEITADAIRKQLGK